METTRRQQIEQLYHAALRTSAEDRAAFVVAACAGDETLRCEVESLLDSSETAFDLSAASQIALAAHPMDAPATHVLTGQRFGVYRIQERLGVGGMGEVYRAHDVSLRRDVAFKVLRQPFPTDPERLARSIARREFWQR
jgi:serine/threonine protein kinase